MIDDAKPDRRTEGDPEVTGAPSHRDVAARVAGAQRFAISLPVVGRVPLPRPDQLAFYAALAGLVAVELVEWPVAVAIGAGHALVSRTQDNPPPQPD
ncbi:hypothetical protein NIIDNTM18_13320 [Mycolicibacterium litorale]|uniref:Uncharacterized protein n=1 Tax=Mycolicibacterium litorale TaxID=758802 RepID=A0A6S6NZX9_9MYCO|nr:hypothetical protein [Mycolicibacterium litorale]BCI52054.1 hypothetical protein NIIDNTM18_13320 [Mycolicibacterium litorale]